MIHMAEKLQKIWDNTHYYTGPNHQKGNNKDIPMDSNNNTGGIVFIDNNKEND